MALVDQPSQSGTYLSEKMQWIKPFQVMSILARARALEAQGRKIVHMEVGEPDFPTPSPIIAAGIEALKQGLTYYTPAVGLLALRQAIADYYADHYGTRVEVEQIIITPGSSGALQLILSVLLNPGDSVLMSDPSYPCNKHLVAYLHADPIQIPVDASTKFQLNVDHLAKFWQSNTRLVMLGSPANPTGNVIELANIQSMVEYSKDRQGFVVVDEIYHGLEYQPMSATAAQLADNCFVVNSFSKYFGMTGWRIGWLVAPPAYVDAIDHLAQNLFLATTTPSQYAALAAFAPRTLAILEQRRQVYWQRRDYLLQALEALGFIIPVKPEGAFYIYADSSRFAEDSFQFAEQMLETIGVAITPGMDFGVNRANQYVRFAYTTSLEQLQQGVARMQDYLPSL